MSEISASMVRDLREKSGAGMMECKKALEATGGDMEKAFDELRKSGLKSAAKKVGRETGEGRVVTASSGDGRRGAMVALACETDFVAKTPDFEGYLAKLAQHVLEHRPTSVEALLSQPWAGGGTVEESVKSLVGRLGENIQVTQVVCYDNPKGLVASYVHHDQKKGAIVNVTTGADSSAGEAALKDLCMHIVVFAPQGLNRSSIPADLVEREKAIIRDSIKDKPAEMQEKILTGRLEKWYAEQVITEQPWIKDDKTTVGKALTAALGAGTELIGFTRFQVGG